MQPVKTDLTQLLGIRVPIVCAAMAFGTNAQTAVEVTRGGGFGFVGAAFSTPESLKEDFAFIRASFPDLESNKPLPIGYGFIGWLLDKSEDAGKQLIDSVIENGVQAIWLAFGNDVRRWVEYVRVSPANTQAHSDHRPLIFVQVTSVAEALEAANEWKVDVIVAQGTEAGGHGGATTPSTFVLLSEILAALPHDGTAPPVLAAGGMATGAQVAAYLALGAAGAVLGTRFLLTPESPYTDAQKAALLAASSAGPRATVRTLALDYAGDTAYWPAHIDGRGLRNRIVDDVEAGVDHATVQAKCREAMEAGDQSYMIVWAGQGVWLS
uniref:Inosine-5'-monophosphate dehydrogenase (IMP dehydrogenase) (IMPD) (IMPDH) (EC) n=1 Tax=Ganoderma boninense TaxID=34458 RepID=A0A5K1JU21_9APHY|nr:Inosine-5'-monophosphate dehydrogenase (IMP dehydrogenase) (IMPD) (IMPDH) (EC [Ganoderma boninense]